jgi:endonuclease/exonuclease/phosphatase family metal-dependent hydrolase
MIKQLKEFSINLVAGANIAIVAAMLLTGYADRFHPAEHPLLACLGLVFPLFLLLNLLFLFFWLLFKWKRAWIPVAGYLLAYIPIKTYLPLNPQKDLPEGCIKVISYNVCSYGGNYKYEDAFERILDYFQQHQADIVCLQEDVDAWRRYAMIKYEKQYQYNDTTIFCKTSESMNGVGIHTRFPILRKERIMYDSKANGSVAYYLKRGNDTLLVINNHFEGTHLSSEDRENYKGILRGDIKGDTAKAESMYIIDKLGKYAAVRAVEAETVRQYIASHRQYPTIVCGDFNDTPISYTRRILTQGLTDCYSESGKGIGLSYNQKGFWVRIDHILCSSDFTPYNCQVDAKIDYSDHYPMICWLKMHDNP